MCVDTHFEVLSFDWRVLNLLNQQSFQEITAVKLIPVWTTFASSGIGYSRAVSPTAGQSETTITVADRDGPRWRSRWRTSAPSGGHGGGPRRSSDSHGDGRPGSLRLARIERQHRLSHPGIAARRGGEGCQRAVGGEHSSGFHTCSSPVGSGAQESGGATRASRNGSLWHAFMLSVYSRVSRCNITPVSLLVHLCMHLSSDSCMYVLCMLHV